MKKSIDIHHDVELTLLCNSKDMQEFAHVISTLNKLVETEAPEGEATVLQTHDGFDIKVKWNTRLNMFTIQKYSACEI